MKAASLHEPLCRPARVAAALLAFGVGIGALALPWLIRLRPDPRTGAHQPLGPFLVVLCVGLAISCFALGRRAWRLRAADTGPPAVFATQRRPATYFWSGVAFGMLALSHLVDIATMGQALAAGFAALGSFQLAYRRRRAVEVPASRVVLPGRDD